MLLVAQLLASASAAYTTHAVVHHTPRCPAPVAAAGEQLRFEVCQNK